MLNYADLECGGAVEFFCRADGLGCRAVDEDFNYRVTSIFFVHQKIRPLL